MSKDDGRSVVSFSSGVSNITVKPPTPSRSASAHSRPVPRPIKTSENGRLRLHREDHQISPSSPTGHRHALSPTPSTVSPSSLLDNRRMSDLANYRRDLAVLEPSGGRLPQIYREPPSGLNVPPTIAPWMTNGGPAANASPTTFDSFYVDSSDNLSTPSQLSPAFRPSLSRPGQGSITDSPDMVYFDEQRRPSIASITTASSQGSKNSSGRGGMKKLQEFFGEELPGWEGSETSLPPVQVTAKEQRSYSFGRSRRGRNDSNATDHTREPSPAPSRPRTPVPSSDVVPFLYQEADDIAKYGEAPVRDILSGPDRERFAQDNAGPGPPPQTSSSFRSNHSVVHLSGHHRQNKSLEEPRSSRPYLTGRQDSSLSIHTMKERGGSTATDVRSRAQSPAPSSHSNGSRLASVDGQISPGGVGKRGIMELLRRRKQKDDRHSGRNRNAPGSQSTVRSTSRPDITRATQSSYEKSSPSLDIDREPREPREQRSSSRQTTFSNKFPFTKKPRPYKMFNNSDELIGPTDRNDKDTMFHLDTNLNDMEGILSRPVPLTPMDPATFQFTDNEPVPPTLEPVSASTKSGGRWNAPDSWDVHRTALEKEPHVPEVDEVGTPPPPEETGAPHCIRVFRSDGTFATVQLPLSATVTEVMNQVIKKTLITEGVENYHIVLKKHNLCRILAASERPLQIQKRLLQQAGYEERDRLEDIGREDIGYLCRFLFLSARDSIFNPTPQDLGFGRAAKFNHVNLAGRNLTTIPITLYSKTADIISLNLSRNLSLALPRDFIQSCPSLRDIKYTNNEARKLPISISRATKLTLLDVSNNRLEQLEHADLPRLNGLLRLTLVNNRLKSLPQDFNAFKSLRVVNLSSNFLDKFPVTLCALESLIYLDVSFNAIGSLPEEIGNLRSLEKFVITNNRLTGSLPSTFSRLANLRELDLKYNTLTSIDVISELPKLEVLSADHNHVSQFVGSFERVRSLKLNANPITKFDIVNPVPTLKLLNLSNAQLASIDGAFNNMVNLERLNLDRNYFVSLPSTIGNLHRLEHFSIAHNSVGELPPEIGCLTELRILDVRGNNIRKLPMDIWWARKLETLNASSNVLENFPKPASRQPQPPLDVQPVATVHKMPSNCHLSRSSSTEDLLPDGSRRPSQASSTLLSVGPNPINSGSDRKSSVVSVYGKGGRKTSVVSRSTAGSVMSGTLVPSGRKDSGLSTRLTNTFANSLRQLILADNQIDDDAFEQIMLLSELRVLNLSYNDLSDMPQRCIKHWPQLVELYLSGNDLTSLPVDDLEEYSLLQVLHINNNKFTNLPADISRAKNLAVLDCGNNSLKYNISNVPYDWNWNLNLNLRYLNLSGNKRLEIKQHNHGTAALNREQYTDFSRLQNLRVLGLMDVTLTQPSIPDQSEDRRVRTSGSLAGHLPYGMADTLGRHEHLSTIDLVVPRFNSSNTETLLGLFDGQALSSGGSKIAKYLHENFGHIFTLELKALKTRQGETPADALRRAFLTLNKELVTVGVEHTEKRSVGGHRGSAGAPVVLSKEDLHSGGVATIAYLQSQELYIANVGDAQAMLIQSDGTHKLLTRKHDPAEPSERQRIRDAGGWVSRQGKLNDVLEVSRSFGYVDLIPAVQAAPDVNHISITPQDETIVIATKELWEYLHPQLIVDVSRSERGDLMRASQKLRDLAMAYGSASKIMVMMISVADLKRRQERSTRLHRGQSMSLYPSGVPDDFQYPAKRGKKPKGGIQDSDLHRLEAEVPAPTDKLTIVFTDIKNSTNLWEMYPDAMRSAIKLHNEVMRRQLRRIGGYEVKTEGDAFMVSFPTATSALLWCFSVQMQLLEVNWPSEVLNSVSCQEVCDKDSNLMFKGLSVRMGMHYGEPVAEVDPVTRRMDYFGPMVNKASRISAVADGGQIAVSADFISEIQRCLETYQENERSGSLGSDEAFDDTTTANAIRKELKSLTAQGFEVKEMGEKKLKGLENPEYVYSLYPHALAGRIDFHMAPAVQADQPARLVPGSELGIDPEMVWSLWKVSLRLEMLCSSLEEVTGKGIQAPETELLERMQHRGGEVTDRFLFNFLEHQVSRIETCVSTLYLRHTAAGGGQIRQLDDLRAPMAVILSHVAKEMAELERYRAKYGPLLDSPLDQDSGTEQ
ncbi:protein phosphatase 2C [Xylaria sp. CBS 124048]|nr:protein phosphatase 2C [Xylaria sp. CBS 124048]